MFDSLKALFGELASLTEEKKVFANEDYRIATAALLIHLISIDNVIDKREQTKLRKILKDRYELTESETAELIEIAQKADEDSVDLYHFTSILKQSLDEDERIQIIEMMWEIVFADGQVQEFEENLVWRVAELLAVSRRDRIRMRQLVKKNEEDSKK